MSIDDGQRGVTEKASGADRVSVTPKCQECGAELIRKLGARGVGFGVWIQRYRKGASWCSNACRQKAYRRRKSTSVGAA